MGKPQEQSHQKQVSKHTALHNHSRTFLEEMTSWTALTWYIRMETAFKTINISKSNIFGLLLKRFKILRVFEEKAYFRKYSSLQPGTHKIGF